MDELGVSRSNLKGCVPKEDFGGGHPDPNLTYAPALVSKMGLCQDGTIKETSNDVTPSFGAACDGKSTHSCSHSKHNAYVECPRTSQVTQIVTWYSEHRSSSHQVTLLR